MRFFANLARPLRACDESTLLKDAASKHRAITAGATECHAAVTNNPCKVLCHDARLALGAALIEPQYNRFGLSNTTQKSEYRTNFHRLTPRNQAKLYVYSHRCKPVVLTCESPLLTPQRHKSEPRMNACLPAGRQMNANKLNRGGCVARWVRGRGARMSGYVLLPILPHPRSSAFICGFQAGAFGVVVLLRSLACDGDSRKPVETGSTELRTEATLTLLR